MYKKITILLLIIIILIPAYTSFAFDEDPEDIDVNRIIETSLNISDNPQVNSAAAVVIERNTNTVLYSKNSDSKRKMASTTKIMTATIVLENCSLNEKVKISPKAASIGGSRLGLTSNIEMSVRDLLYGLMLCSGNDAAYALAEHVAGSVENFAILMNNKAKELNLNNTSFVTPHGLDSDNHYTTAYELALLANYSLKNDTFRKIVSTKFYTVKIGNNSKNIKSTNELLGNFSGVYGVKTGFTNGANRCLVTAAKRNNLDIICVVLGADTKKIRTTDSITLLNYCFSNYTMVNLNTLLDDYFSKNISSSAYEIEKAASLDLSLCHSPLPSEYYPIKISKADLINFSYSLKEPFISPIEANTNLGTISIFIENDKIFDLSISSSKQVSRKSIDFYLYNFFSNYFNYLYQK